jgi:serine/threonine protein kinase
LHSPTSAGAIGRIFSRAVTGRGREREDVSTELLEAELARPANPVQQRTIGRYELRREIGRGAMGVVYEARDPLLERTVAVKMIQIAFATSPEESATFRERFFAEARIAACLSHPGIVVVHDVGRDAGTGELYIAMEHLEGRTLSDVLRPGVALDWREALRITGRLAEALHHAHVHGVVHRDMKPANVMLLASGEPKIMDFGVAKTETACFKLTLAGQSIGTPLYASPEQILGHPVDGRSDVFSLGAIAYSLLTGHDAFAAGNLAGVVSRVIGSDPALPSSLVPDLPPQVDRVIARALAKELPARYQDGAALGEDIAALLAGLPPRHADPSPSGDETLPIPHPPDRTLDLEAEFAALVEPRSDGPVQREAGTSPPAARPKARRAALWWLGLASAALGAIGVLAAARSPAHSERQASAPLESGAAETTNAHGAVAPAAALREPGHLSIRFQRPPRGASVRVWVDRTLVAQERWVDRPEEPTRLLAFGASGPDTLHLEPGGHDVEVELAWEGKRSSSRIWGEVRPGATRRLVAKVGGVLRKHLSLEWD